jgi:exosome complex exonuclease DIS3/RRP44
MYKHSLQVVREHYLRDDIYSGSPLDPECPPEAAKLSGEAPHYLLIDTNVALHQVAAAAASRHSSDPGFQ